MKNSDQNQKDKQIEIEIRELKESLWKLEKKLGLRADDLLIYDMIKTCEERLNVIETKLGLDV